MPSIILGGIMHNWVVSQITITAFLGSAVQPALAEPSALEPSSQWHLNYADDYCRLARVFGGPGHETVLYLEQYEPSDAFTVQIAGPDFASEKLRKPSLRFGPDGGSEPSEFLMGSSFGRYGSGLLASNMTLLPEPDAVLSRPVKARGEAAEKEYSAIKVPLDPASAAHITWFEMLEKDLVVGRLALGSMRDPIKAMNACTDELLTHWGIDVAKHRTRSRAVAPKGNPENWIDSGDYPSDLLSKGAQGLVIFRLDIDEQGRATKCTVQQSTRPPGFDEVVCRKIKSNARFEPALDLAGKPMKSYWRSSVRFQIPR